MDAAILIFRVHALKRMFERGIGETEVRDILEQGEIIERYPNDSPYPSNLMLGYSNGRALHVVVAHNSADNAIIVVTVYVPDPKRWDKNFRVRIP
jgi:hypothetical protein